MLPAVTGLGAPVFTMATSAEGATGVWMVAVLLLGTGSVVVECTWPVLVTVPVVDACTVTSIVTVASAPAGSVPRSQLTVSSSLGAGALGG